MLLTITFWKFFSQWDEIARSSSLIFGPLESLLFNSNSHIVFTFFILIHFSNRSIHTPQYTLTRFIYFFLVCTNLFVCLLGISVWLIQPTLLFFGPNQLTLELDWGSPRFFCLIDKLCVILFFTGSRLFSWAHKFEPTNTESKETKKK